MPIDRRHSRFQQVPVPESPASLRAWNRKLRLNPSSYPAVRERHCRKGGQAQAQLTSMWAPAIGSPHCHRWLTGKPKLPGRNREEMRSLMPQHPFEQPSAVAQLLTYELRSASQGIGGDLLQDGTKMQDLWRRGKGKGLPLRTCSWH